MGTSVGEHLRQDAAISGLRLFPLIGYFATIVAAESIATFWRPPPNAEGILLGMILHVVLLFTLLLHAALLAEVDVPLSQFLAALSLAPLIRILSLALPGLGAVDQPVLAGQIARLEWFLLMTVALVGAAATLGVLLRIPPRKVGLGLGVPRLIPWQVPVALSGLGLGAVEFLVLTPPSDLGQLWIPALTLPNLLLAAVAIGLASGFAEELIFRGFILNRSERLLGALPALFLVSLLFAAMHIGFVVNPAGQFDPVRALDVPFVFGVGLYFGWVVQKSRTIWGVIVAHGLANVMLYLVLPSIQAVGGV